MVGGNAATGIGTISTTGLYQAPPAVPNGSAVTISVELVADTTVFATATVVITAIPTVAISPTTLTLAPAVPAAPTLLTATLTGVPANDSTAVTWEIGNVVGGNAAVGFIVPVSAPAAMCQSNPPCTATANYTPPAVPPPGGTIVVNVFLNIDNTQSAGAAITLTYAAPSIQGSYAFSVAGQNAAGFFARAGQFTATIVGGVGTLSGFEDIHTPTTVTTDTAVSGTYTVGPDGRGTAVLTDTTGTTNYYLTVVSANQIKLTEADNSATAHGEADLQDPTSFAQSKFLGGYAFDFYGTSGAAHPTSEIGQFTATGSGAAIQNGLEDVNAAGTLTPAAGLSGSFGAINAATGRGVATINGFSGPTTFAFYMISAGQARFIETDASANLVGDALQQSGTANLGYLSSLNVFTVSGRSGTGKYAMAGAFLADGNGNLCTSVPNSNCLLDQNNSGTVATTVQYSGTYTVAASGRGTLTISPSGQPAMTFVMYFVSTGDAILQETDASIVADGVALSQRGGPFATSNVTGSFALNWSGAVPATTAQQDTTGQLTLKVTGGTASIAGTWDRNDALVLQPGIALTGSYTLAVGRGSVTLTDASNITYDLAAYVANSNTVFLVDTDPTLVFAGQLARQF
jgi:flagellar basal body rod protein FlgG